MNKRVSVSVSAIGLLLFGIGFGAESRASEATQAPGESVVFALRGERFWRNDGQYPEEVKYYASIDGGTVFFTESSMVTDVRDAPREDGSARRTVIRVGWEGAGGGARILPGEELPGTLNVFRGSDPEGWATHVPGFRGITYRSIRPGIDMIYSFRGGLLKYDLDVSPEADLESFVLRYEGADSVRIGGDGALAVHAGGKVFREEPPLLLQDGGERGTGAYKKLGRNEIGYTLSGVDRSRPLTIDPGLTWSTYLGGSGPEDLFSLKLDSENRPVFVGEVLSSDFPTTAGSFQESTGVATDASVTKLSADGSALVFSTYLGGDNFDAAREVALASDGSIAIVGKTNSTDFPTKSAYCDTFSGGLANWGDVFVTRLGADGDSLVFSTYLGGPGGEYGRGLTVDDEGNVFVIGQAGAGFPTTAGAFDTTSNGESDAFLSKLSADGLQLLASTFFGGQDCDNPREVRMAPGGDVLLVGETASLDLPLMDACDSTLDGTQDSFIARFPSSLDGLLFCTYIGGDGLDSAVAMVVDPDGNAVVTGRTTSLDFPTTPGAYREAAIGEVDGFLFRFDFTANAIDACTYFGGTEDEDAWIVDLDPDGKPVVSGHTHSADYPVTIGSADPTYNGDWDVFVTRFTTDLTAVDYSTYIGGDALDYNKGGLVIDGNGDAVVAGYTRSANFPVTQGAYDQTPNGLSDYFIAKLPLEIQTAVGGAVPETSGRIFVNAPNPFNPLTVFSYSLAEPARVRLDLYDAAGRRVTGLDEGFRDAGTHHAEWSGKDGAGREVPSGVYYARLKAGEKVFTRKVVLVR
ncbi:MAG: SBBP repeat-containing protein [Candidatus Eisenbacteria bacterium]|nr:SBBP repeat-containing protein [Candidatus Eisenbacteria bacterium]